MSTSKEQVLIPIEQALVPFHSGEILGIRLPYDLIAGTLNSLCALIGLAPHGQLQRIRRDKDLSEHLLLAMIETPGGPQRVDALVVGAIAPWVMGLYHNKIAPEKRPLALALKFEAADALYRHFFQANTKQTAKLAGNMLPEPDAMWERQYEAMVGFEREWRAMKVDIAALKSDLGLLRADITEMKADIATLKAGQQKPANAAASAARQTGDRLSHDHIVHLFVLARSLQSRTGEPLGALLRELAAAFQVTDFGELPDSAWDGVLAWFWQQSQG